MNRNRLIVIFLSILSSTWAIHFAASRLEPSAIEGHTVPAINEPSAFIRSMRPAYPYSIISGGAYTPAELQSAQNRDPVIRAHYSDFDASRAKMVVLTDDRFEYVSYRVKGQVYWTKKKLRIPKGELLITDGSSWARARCGNRLSDKPHAAAIDPHEPEAALLSVPSLTPGNMPNLDMGPSSGYAIAEAPSTPTQTGVTEAPSAPAPTLVGPALGSGPIYAGPMIPPPPGTPTAGGGPKPNSPSTPVTPPTDAPPPVSPIPEPNSLYLFLISFAVSAWALTRMLTKDEPKK